MISRQKQIIQQIQDGKKSPEMSSDYMCILSDTWWMQSMGRLCERVKKILPYISSSIPQKSPANTHKLILAYDYTELSTLNKINTSTIILC